MHLLLGIGSSRAAEIDRCLRRFAILRFLKLVGLKVVFDCHLLASLVREGRLQIRLLNAELGRNHKLLRIALTHRHNVQRLLIFNLD